MIPAKKPGHHAIDPSIDAEFLEANASVIVREPQRYEFSPAEIREMKVELADHELQLKLRSKLESAAKEAINKTDDPLESLQFLLERYADEEFEQLVTAEIKEQAKRLAARIRLGYKEDEVKLFGFSYPEARRMAFYDSHGLYVYDRPLRDGEQTVFSISKSA